MLEQDVIIGRFNPPHLGHLKVFETMKNPIIVIVYTTKDTMTKNPLKIEERIELLREIASNIPNAKIIPSSTGFLNDILTNIDNDGYNYRNLYAGEDRYYSYQTNIEKYDLPKPVSLIKTERFTSGTYIRQCIKNNNQSMFKALTPPPTHKYYDVLYKRLNHFRKERLEALANLRKFLVPTELYTFKGDNYSNLQTTINRNITQCRKFVQGRKDYARVQKILEFFITFIKCYNLEQEYDKMLLSCDTDSALSKKMIKRFSELVAQKQTKLNLEV
ncbi:MAG: hypothetical protein QM489_00700 [Candidatus Izemoplasma sp.]